MVQAYLSYIIYDAVAPTWRIPENWFVDPTGRWRWVQGGFDTQVYVSPSCKGAMIVFASVILRDATRGYGAPPLR